MDQNKIQNIMHNLMYELDIADCFKRTIKKLVEQHWPKRSVIYRFICNIVDGSKVVDENKLFYVVHWNTECCRSLMDKIQATTLVTTKRRWAHTTKGAPMVEVKVYK